MLLSTLVLDIQAFLGLQNIVKNQKDLWSAHFAIRELSIAKLYTSYILASGWCFLI